MIIKFIGSNSGFKLISLIMAIVLWFFMAMKIQSEITIEVPIKFKDIPEGYEITNRSAKTINVTLKGKESIIENIKAQDINIFIPLDNVKEGDSIYYLTKDNLTMPEGLNLKLISPANLKVKIEKIISRYIKIMPIITGEPIEGYKVKDVVVDPQQIMLKGTKTLLDGIQCIKTESIDVTNKKETFSQNIQLSYEGKTTKNPVDKVMVTVIIKRLKAA